MPSNLMVNNWLGLGTKTAWLGFGLKLRSGGHRRHGYNNNSLVNVGKLLKAMLTVARKQEGLSS